MVSAYLEYPIRTLEQALLDQKRALAEPPDLGPGMPASPTVGRYDPARLMVRLLAEDHDRAVAGSTPAGGRGAA